MNFGTSWHTSYLPIIVVRSLSRSVTSLCDSVDCSTPDCSVLHCLREFAQILSIKSVMLRPSHPLLPLLHSPWSFPASGSFPARQFFISGGQSIGASTSESVLPMSIQGWFPLRLTGFISLLSKGLSGVFSSTTVRRHQLFGTLLSLQSSSHNRTWPLGRP